MDLMQQLLSAPWAFLRDYGLPLLVVLSVLVFVHELGHYLVARYYRVRILQFSIGFGPEIFGRSDKHGTRWSFRAIPLGGYVQMFGDTDPASVSHDTKVSDAAGAPREMTAEERAQAFFTKPVGQRAAIVFAGPAINYIFAIVVLTALYVVNGQPLSPAIAAKVIEGSPAAKAGIKPDDKIVSVDGTPVKRFQDLKQIVTVSFDRELVFEVVSPVKKRGKVAKGEWQTKSRTIRIKPELKEETDRFGFKHASGRIGIMSAGGAPVVEKMGPVEALGAAIVDTYGITRDTLKALGQIVMGTRSTDELGGIIRIGAYAGEFARNGIVAFIGFTALLSVNLGLINLLPIPVLDGGHLVMYAMEKTTGKPLNEKAQEYALRVGLVFILGMMMLATWNDVVQLKLVDYIVKLVS